MGLLLGIHNIFDFGLVFLEIFVFKNRLPGIVYYKESKLSVSFTAGSQNSPSCLLRGVVTPSVIYFAELL